MIAPSCELATGAKMNASWLQHHPGKKSAGGVRACRPRCFLYQQPWETRPSRGHRVRAGRRWRLPRTF